MNLMHQGLKAACKQLGQLKGSVADQGPCGRLDTAERGQAAAQSPVQLRCGQAQPDAPGASQVSL